MAKLRFRTLSPLEARRWADEIDGYTEEEFDSLLKKWKSGNIPLPDPDYAEFRSIIADAYSRSENAGITNRGRYDTDVEVGLDLYEYLQENGFTLNDASNDDVWRYLSIKVFPDLVYLRYPDPEKEVRENGGRINRKRFFSHTRRIWLKTLWWYVHLSWQGSKGDTRRVLADNGSNIISHFIETPGRGYRTDLYRVFMKKYSQRSERGDKVFRAIMKLNNAECRNVEPALFPEGVEGYCSMLFAKYDDNRKPV